jgi:hypothetical protein
MGFLIGTLDIVLLFSAAHLTFISLHVAAVSIRWVGTNRIEGRHGIPYAPSLARLDEIVHGVADVEDLIQDVAIRLARSIGCEIRPLFTTGSARGQSAPAPWIVQAGHVTDTPAPTMNLAVGGETGRGPRTCGDKW